MSQADDQQLQTDANTLALLLDSLEQPASHRLKWLQQQHQYASVIRDEVRKILQREPDLGPFAEPIDAIPDDSERIGQIIGGYRLIRLIGRGGMGAVYLAERIRDFEHRCAIKLIRGGRITTDSRTHFIRERQNLASMQHPYIAHLLDGGSTDDGDDFLLMEWVDGQMITDYCHDQQLSRSKMLALFRKVCQALEYAHANLLVHGDIKPNNILVTSEGTPKLLDFGIAQHLQQPKDERQRAMSRYFASPEQLAHRKLTVASDIYSLCTLLQVLLCGSVDGNNERYRRLPAELRSIITVGRSTEPAQRYANVTQLLNDCDNYRDDKPLQAHGNSWRYRAKKFIQRNRLAVSAGTLLALSLIIGAGISLWQANIARAQKQQAEQFSQTLVELLNAPDPYADGSARTVEDMLDRAGEQLLAESNTLPAEVQSDLLVTLGQVYVNIDAMDKAKNIARILRNKWSDISHANNQAYARAHHFSGIIASRTGEYETARSSLELAHNWYQQYSSRSADAAENIYELGSLYMFSGQEQQARDLWAVGIERFSSIDEPWVNLWLAQIYNNLGVADELLGEFESARDNYRLSIEYFPSKHSLAAATQLGNLASVERKLGNIYSAIELLNQSLQMHYDVVGPEHKEVSMIHSDLALAYTDDQQAEPALEHARMALENALAQSGETHRNTAAAYFALGNAELFDQQDHNAQLNFQQALEIRQQLLGEDHQRTLDVAVSLAQIQCRDNNLSDARQAQAQLGNIIDKLKQQAGVEQHSPDYYLTRAQQALMDCQI